MTESRRKLSGLTTIIGLGLVMVAVGGLYLIRAPSSNQVISSPVTSAPVSFASTPALESFAETETPVPATPTGTVPPSPSQSAPQETPAEPTASDVTSTPAGTPLDCAAKALTVTPHSYPPGASFRTDPALESTLPRSILGQPTKTSSAVGEPATDGIYGAMGKLMATCLGRKDSDVTLATALPADPDPGFWWVQAFKIRGATGAQLEHALLTGMPTLLQSPAQVRASARKSYRVYAGRVAVYTHADVIYVTWQFGLFVDKQGSLPPAPDPVQVFDDVVRQLP
jgi:hypothetical protein